MPLLPRLAGLLLAILIAGCATTTGSTSGTTGAAAPSKPDTRHESRTEARPEVKEVSPAQAALNAGISLYNNGEFTAAIKKFSTSNEIWRADKAIQLEALKYMAFSYCVTSHQVLCKQQFDKAFKLDPSFDLAPGEKGHPLWGPVFERSKRQK